MDWRAEALPVRPAEASPGAALAVSGLEVLYGNAVRALRGVTIEVPAGAIVAVLGANGAGKTTLLRAVTGLLALHRGAISNGDVSLDGRSLQRLDPAARVRSGVAQVMEGRRVFAELSVEENLRAGAFTAREGSADARERVFELFPVLRERLRLPAGYLSGGEQQMLAIARALMARPRLLLLDEPSLGLAPRLVAQIRDVIVEINRQGTTVLLIEQNARMALSIAGHGYVLETGRVAVEGPAARLVDDRDVQELYLGIGERRRRRGAT